jgi:hypothetical protein
VHYGQYLREFARLHVARNVWCPGDADTGAHSDTGQSKRRTVRHEHRVSDQLLLHGAGRTYHRQYLSNAFSNNVHRVREPVTEA